MMIDEEVLECIRKMACQGDCDGLCEEGVNDECVRNVHCLGMCGGSCGPDLDLTDVEYGSSLQVELSSTLDECVRNVQCPGACKDACVTDSITSVLVNEKGSSLQSVLGSPQVHGTLEIEHYSRANMDWGRVGGAVQNLEGVSINDIAGVKYCPGGGLPTFEYSEHKPRCSKTERTHFIYRGDKAKDVYETGCCSRGWRRGW